MEDPDLLEHIRRNVLIDLEKSDTVSELPDIINRQARKIYRTQPALAADGGSQFDPSQGGGFTSKLLVPTFFSHLDKANERQF